MTEPERKARNAEMLSQLVPGYLHRFLNLMKRVEDREFRIRIQEAYRTPERQVELWRAGLSKLKKNGRHVQRLAIDVVDDDRPLDPSPAFIAALAIDSWTEELQTGCLWSLPMNMVRERLICITGKDLVRLTELLARHRGWDPLHVEVP